MSVCPAAVVALNTMDREIDVRHVLPSAQAPALVMHARGGQRVDVRYITRPALTNERVQTNAAGPVVLKLKTPWRDGTTHLVLSPLEFMRQSTLLAHGRDSRASDCFKAINSG